MHFFKPSTPVIVSIVVVLVSIGIIKIQYNMILDLSSELSSCHTILVNERALYKVKREEFSAILNQQNAAIEKYKKAGKDLAKAIAKEEEKLFKKLTEEEVQILKDIEGDSSVSNLINISEKVLQGFASEGN